MIMFRIHYFCKNSFIVVVKSHDCFERTLNSFEFCIKFDDREFRIMWFSIFATFQNKFVFDFLRKFLRIVNNDCIFEEFDDFVDFLKKFLLNESFFVQRRRRQNIENCFRFILVNSKKFRDRIKKNDHNRNLNRDANEWMNK